MTLELLNTLGTFATFVVIAATAIAALVQLRHLRAGNQVNAMISIGNQFDDKTFRDALYLAPKVASAVNDEVFRNYDLAIARRLETPPVPQEFVDVRSAALLAGNFYEELGILVKNGAIDKDLVFDRWSANIMGTWHRMVPYIAWLRKAQGSNLVWENFEYVTVLAEDWINVHAGGTYPQGVRRLPLPETWPILAAAPAS